MNNSFANVIIIGEKEKNRRIVPVRYGKHVNDANDEAAQHAATEIFRKIFGLWVEISDGVESESVFKSEDMLRVDEMYVSNSEQQSRTSRHWNIKTEKCTWSRMVEFISRRGKKIMLLRILCE